MKRALVISRRAFIGASAVTAAVGLAGAPVWAEPPKEIRIGYQKNGVLVVARQQAVLGKTAPVVAEDPKIGIDDFLKVDMRVGVVKEAAAVKGSDKLLHLQIDIGEPKTRSIVAGIESLRCRCQPICSVGCARARATAVSVPDCDIMSAVAVIGLVMEAIQKRASGFIGSRVARSE